MSITIKQAEIKRVPQLRFPGFVGGWEEKRLGEVASFFSGGTPMSSRSDYYLGDIPFIKSGEIAGSSTAQCITEEALKSSSARIVEKGDLLFALYGATSGEVAISQVSGAINQAVLCIRTRENIKWLLDYLKANKLGILEKYIQGGQGNLSAGIVRDLKITWPEREEQEKIAEFLGGVDEWIGNLRGQKEAWEDYKKGMMQKIFSQEIRFKDGDSEDFEDWEEEGLGDMCSFIKDGTHGTHPDTEGGGYRLLSAKNIKDGKVNVSSSDREISKEEHGKIHSKYVLQPKDLLLSIVGTIGNVALFDGRQDVAFQRSVAFFRLRKDSTSFIYYIFSSYLFQNELKRRQVVSAQPGVYLGDLSKMRISLPELDEQKKIAEFLGEIDEMINSTQEKITKAESWKKGLMQRMFV